MMTVDSFNATIANGTMSNSGSINPLGSPTAKLNNYPVQLAQPTGRGAANVNSGRKPAKPTGKWLSQMKPEERRAYFDRKGLPNLKRVEPDPIKNSAKSQGGQLRPWLNALNGWGDWLGEQLETALVEEELKPPKTTQQSFARPSLNSFLKSIEGKFTCERGGRPCVAKPGDPMPNRIVIGWEHTGLSEKWGEELIKGLLGESYKDKGFKIIVEAAPAALEDNNFTT